MAFSIVLHLWCNFCLRNNCYVLSYISPLLRALLLVNLAGRTLLYGPLKLKSVFVAKCFVIYHQVFSTFSARVLKFALKLKLCIKTCSHFKLTRSAFDARQKFD